MHSSLGFVVACTVTGAAVKNNCPAASRATAFCDMHVNCNVRLILPVWVIIKKSNLRELTAVSSCCPPRTYSYELNLCFSLAGFHSDSSHHHLVRAANQSLKALLLFSSGLLSHR